MTLISVIICTHNPREDYLRRTLDALEAQTLPKDKWELLLIDNASKESLADKWDLSWHSQAYYIREEELGLTPARLRGIQESKGGALVFVDDDNVLDPQYLENALHILDQNKCLGCIGAGLIRPEFEHEPDPMIRPYCNSLALREIFKPEWSNIPQEANRPYGAGLVVDAKVAKKYLEVVSSCIIRKALDRTGNSLLSGGDDEFSFVACEMNMGVGVFPQLQLVHLIPKRRIELEYLLKVTEGHGYSRAILLRERGLPMPSKYEISQLKDILINVLKLKLSTSLTHLNSWWFSKHAPKYENQFRCAWANGVKKAIQKLDDTL
jgi:glycosyltransferase involved in cell wall biosynthesis